MASNTRSPLILTTSKDWEPWLELIKVAALEHNIWKYINPTLPRVTTPTMPTRPTPSMVKPDIIEPGNPPRPANFSDLSSDEREQLRWMNADYDDNRQAYQKEMEAIGKIRVKIQESVDPKHFVYTRGDTAHEVLIKLKA